MKDTLLGILIMVIFLAIIFAFALFSYHAVLSSEKTLVKEGLKDKEVVAIHDKMEKAKKKHVKNRISLILSIVVVSLMSLFVVFSLIYRGMGNLIWLGDTSTMVIASDSMSEIADPEKDQYHQTSENGGYLSEEMIHEEFSRGDMITLEKVPEEKEMVSDGVGMNGEYETLNSPYLNRIFAFRYQNTTIVHRLIYIEAAEDGTALFVFQGDRYPGNRQEVTYQEIIGMKKEGSKIKVLGWFILFFQSLYGVFVILGSVGMLLLSTLAENKLEKIYLSRYPFIPQTLSDKLTANLVLEEGMAKNHKEKKSKKDKKKDPLSSSSHHKHKKDDLYDDSLSKSFDKL